MKKIITVIALTVSFGGAQAQSWEQVGKTANGEPVFIDLHSLRKEDGRFVMVQQASKKPFEPIRAFSFRTIFDCQNKTLRYSDEPQKIETVASNTIGAATYNYVCDLAFFGAPFARVK